MTREEAINILKQYIDYDNPDVPDFYTMAEACEVVIKALEQEPLEVEAANLQKVYNKGFEDCRQAVLDLPRIKTHNVWGNVIYESVDVENVRQLPPVTPQPCDDCISRQAAIDIIDKWVKSMHVLIELPANEVTPLFESVHELPSVAPQPKMGYWEWNQYDANPKIGNFHCSLCHSIGRSYFDYCPYCGAKMSEIPTGAEGSEE